jgi:hypothetical protein
VRVRFRVPDGGDDGLRVGERFRKALPDELG